MSRFLKENIVYLGVIASSLTLFLISLFTNNYLIVELLVLGVVMTGFALFTLFPNIEKSLYWIIFFAPISLEIGLMEGVKLSAPTEILSLLVIALFALKWFWGLTVNFQILKHPISILLILDIFWTLFTALSSEFVSVSLKRLAIKVIFFIVYYFFMSHFLRDATSLKKIFWLYGLGFILPILSALFIHSQTGFIQASSFSACQPFYSDHTLYAACLAFIIPFFILESRQSYSEHKSIVYFNIAMVALLFVAIYFSYSRAAWISLFIALVVYIIIKLKIKFFYIAILLISIITIIATNFESIYGELRENDTKYSDDATAHLSSVTNLQNDASNLERINRWVCAYRMFEERPLLGFGPGTYQFVYDQFQTPEYMTRISTHKGDKGNAHSEYFSYLSETGIIGLIVFMGIVIYSIYLSFNILSRNITKEQRLIVLASLLGLITFFTHGLFNTFSDYEKMSVLYLGSLAILTKVDFDSKAKDI